MNSVSWFIYTAQVAGSLGSLFCFLGGSLMFLCMCRFVFPRVVNFMDDREKKDANFLPPLPVSRAFMGLAVGFLVIGNLMPEKKTMYAIAASQIGERVASSDAVQGLAGDATKALQQWIKRQIDPSTDKK